MKFSFMVLKADVSMRNDSWIAIEKSNVSHHPVGLSVSIYTNVRRNGCVQEDKGERDRVASPHTQACPAGRCSCSLRLLMHFRLHWIRLTELSASSTEGLLTCTCLPKPVQPWHHFHWLNESSGQNNDARNKWSTTRTLLLEDKTMTRSNKACS